MTENAKKILTLLGWTYERHPDYHVDKVMAWRSPDGTWDLDIPDLDNLAELYRVRDEWAKERGAIWYDSGPKEGMFWSLFSPARAPDPDDHAGINRVEAAQLAFIAALEAEHD